MKPGWYILLYHDVSWEQGPFNRPIGGTISPDLFREHLQQVSQLGEIVSVQDGLAEMQRGAPTRPIFSFWFDDGLSGVRKYAAPLLAQYGTTGALSICSRFWMRQELFWRFKLGFLSYIDGSRLLRSRLKKYGYHRQMMVRKFVLDNFSEEIVAEIDAVYRKHVPEWVRKDAFRLFDSAENLLALQSQGWVLANHTAAHYPLSPDTFAHADHGFSECETEFARLTGHPSQFWVATFDRGEALAQALAQGFNDPNRILVLVRNRITQQADIAQRVLYRLSMPNGRGEDAVAYIQKIGQQ